jgi:hypothetical protein
LQHHSQGKPGTRKVHQERTTGLTGSQINDFHQRLGGLIAA